MHKSFLLLIWFACSTSWASDKVLAGWELWYPYQYHDENNKLVGLDIESFDAIFKQANVEYNILELPWKRHLHMIKVGQMDVAMGASKTPEREKYADFSLPYRTEKVNLVVKAGNSQAVKLSTLDDLIGSKYLIGVEGGYYYGEEYQRLIANPQFASHISEVIDIEENVTMLLAGHLDGFLVDPNTLNAFVDKYQLKDKFEIHPLEIYQADIYIMISKKSKFNGLIDKVNQSIRTLKQQGELAKIHQQWSLINQK